MAGSAYFEVFLDEEGAYRWRLRCDGDSLATGSGSFLSDWNADRAARAFKRAAAGAQYSCGQSGGRWHWQCSSVDGRVLASSPASFPSRRAARTAAEQVRSLAAEAIGP